ncbi:MFS transporter [Microbacterium gorillae]|uniref:MFS transporter n=1 Tax=Microbacterium gorillae TaxID=1231063 RepID=UPI00069326A0|nr:MFS transporter [Microbacterium gorillae]
MASRPPVTHGARAWAPLVPMLLGILAGALSVSMVNTAVPRIVDDLGVDDAARPWIVGAYPLALAGCIVIGARLGDWIGRRTVVAIGLGGYAVLNLLAAVQVSGLALIGVRAALGVMSALVIASVVSSIGVLYRGRDLVIANGLWVGVFGAGSAIGPTLGGFITEHLGWPAVFAACAPVAMIGLALVWLVPNTRAEHPAPWDPLSIGTSTVGLAVTLLGLQRLAFDALTGAVLLAIGAACLAVFWIRQRRLARPFLDVRLFSNGSFTLAVLQILAAAGTASAATYLLSVHLQAAAGLTPTATGIALIPQALATVAGGVLAGIVVRLVSDRGALVLALVIQAAGLAGLAIWPTSAAAPLIGIGVGMGLVGTLATSRLFEVAPRSRAADVGAIQEIGFALGGAAWIAMLDAVTVVGGSVGFALALGIASGAVALIAVWSTVDLVRHGRSSGPSSAERSTPGI